MEQKDKSEKKTMKIDVKYVTRVEGHGNIVVDVSDGTLKECRFDVVEAPRFFEAMLRNRSIFEAQHITSRICGICACGHTLASIQAAEDAIGFTPSQQTEMLRELLLHQEILDSHILHIYLLVAPDLLGMKSFVAMLPSHGDAVRRALRMKKCCNDICTTLAGRHVHPISCIVGGFTRLPSTEDLYDILNQLYALMGDMEETIRLFKTLKLPEFQRETEYVALVSDGDEYPLLHGDLGSTDGMLLNKNDYRKLTNEFIVPHSSAKHARASRSSYMVGALARFNLNSEKLGKEAKAVAGDLGMKPKVFNPFLNTAAQLVECVHSLEESVRIVKALLHKGVRQEESVLVGLNENSTLKVKAGKGVGAVEVPRGILFHEYETDEKGTILNANCIIPTSQNVNNLEQDMKKLVPEILEKSEEEMTQLLEMLVRAYDPCISCSAHILDVKYVGKR